MKASQKLYMICMFVYLKAAKSNANISIFISNGIFIMKYNSKQDYYLKIRKCSCLVYQKKFSSKSKHLNVQVVTTIAQNLKYSLHSKSLKVNGKVTKSISQLYEIFQVVNTTLDSKRDHEFFLFILYTSIYFICMYVCQIIMIFFTTT